MDAQSTLDALQAYTGDFVGLALCSPGMIYLWASESWLRMYGLTRDIVGRSHYEIFPGLPEEWKAEHRGVIERGESFSASEPTWFTNPNTGEETAIVYRIGPARRTPQGYQVIMTSANVSALAAKTAELAWLAYHDPMTGLLNRQSLDERIDANDGSIQGVALVDLDGFSRINAAHGHSEGDKVLARVGQRLAEIWPKQAYRNGQGDEFVITSPNANPEILEAIAELAIELIQEPIETETQAHRLSASVGLANIEAGTPEQQRQAADLAMFEAKLNPSSKRILWWTPELGAREKRKNLGSLELKNACAQGSLMLHYQGIHDCFGELKGVEALLRWPKPADVLGRVRVDEMIQWAELSTLILDVGRWVRSQALADAATWHSTPGTQNLIVSINVSKTELLSAGFIQQLEAELEAAGCNPENIALEITERNIGKATEDLAPVFRAAARLKIILALDDYGAGDAGLKPLKELGPDKLKLDASLMPAHRGDLGAVEVLESAITLAKALGVELIVEGVETRFHAQLIRRLSHELGHPIWVQGYYFSKPKPKEELGL